METYLRHFCRYISKLTDEVDIAETLLFIKNNSFDTDEIISAFKGTININKICDQVESDNFLTGYNQDHKHEVLVSFFLNLHNFARDLIIEYEVCKSKTIKISSVVMRDSITLIPHYRRYMKSLLGYEYNHEKEEWVLREESSRKMKCRWGATCIIAARGYQILNAGHRGRRRQSGEDSKTSVVLESLNDELSPKYDLEEEKLSENDFEGQEEEEKVTAVKIVKEENSCESGKEVSVTDTRRRHFGETTTCKYCDRHIEGNHRVCRKCETSRNTRRNKEDTIKVGKSRSLMRINDQAGEMSKGYGSRTNMTVGRCKSCTQRRMQRSLSQGRLGAEESVYENSWQYLRNGHKGGDRSTLCEVCYRERIQHTFSNPLLRSERKLSDKQWECAKCHSRNDSDQDRCRSCSASRKQKTNIVTVTSVRLKCRRCAANNNIKYARCEECDKLKAQYLTSENFSQPGKIWKCSKCTSRNNFNKVHCGFCGVENPALRLESGHRAVEEHGPLKYWACRHCSHRNDVTRQRCGACLKSNPHSPKANGQGGFNLKNQVSDLDEEIPIASNPGDHFPDEIFLIENGKESCL